MSAYRVLISPERRDVLALRPQDVVDQLTGSVVLGLGDVSDGCTPLPQLVPRSEQQFVMDPHVVLNGFEHIVGRSVELAHRSANDFTENGEPLDGHRSSVVGPSGPLRMGGFRSSIATSSWSAPHCAAHGEAPGA